MNAANKRLNLSEEEIYQRLMARITELMETDPDLESRDGIELDHLTAAVELYERVKSPVSLNSAKRYRLMEVYAGVTRMVSVDNPAWHSTYDGEWVRADDHAAEVARLRNDQEPTRAATETGVRRETKRDGNWLDEEGCCKVCDGEIPYGHSDTCDIWKLEKQIRELQAIVASSQMTADDANRLSAEKHWGHGPHGSATETGGNAIGSTHTEMWIATLRAEITSQESLIERMGDNHPETQGNGIMGQIRLERLELLRKLLDFEPSPSKTSGDVPP